MLAALTIAQHTRRTTAAALVTEQENARHDQPRCAEPPKPSRRQWSQSMHASSQAASPPPSTSWTSTGSSPVNDRHGHRVGDEVLIESCDGSRTESRPFDTVARWGGETSMRSRAGRARPASDRAGSRAYPHARRLSPRDDGDGDHRSHRLGREHAARRINRPECGAPPRRRGARRGEADAGQHLRLAPVQGHAPVGCCLDSASKSPNPRAVDPARANIRVGGRNRAAGSVSVAAGHVRIGVIRSVP